METGTLTQIINDVVSHDAPRDYIGASLIGSDCSRQIWYEYRGMEGEPISAKSRRTFSIGKYLEGLILDILQSAGVKLVKPEPFNHFLYYFDKDLPYLQGHADAVILNPETILEIKTANDASFNTFVRKGLKLWNKRYYAQVQAYMGMSGIHRAVVLVLNKNTSEIHDQVVFFDVDYYDELKARAKAIHDTHEAPPRVSHQPFYVSCKMCKFKGVCHGN